MPCIKASFVTIALFAFSGTAVAVPVPRPTVPTTVSEVCRRSAGSEGERAIALCISRALALPVDPQMWTVTVMHHGQASFLRVRAEGTGDRGYWVDIDPSDWSILTVLSFVLPGDSSAQPVAVEPDGPSVHDLCWRSAGDPVTAYDLACMARALGLPLDRYPWSIVDEDEDGGDENAPIWNRMAGVWVEIRAPEDEWDCDSHYAFAYFIRDTGEIHMYVSRANPFHHEWCP